MAYRRRQSNPKSFSTSQEIGSDIKPPPSPAAAVEVEPEPPSLAAQAIRASSAHRDSSISSAYYGDRTVPTPSSASSSNFKESTNKDSKAVEYTSMQNLNESKYGFWGVLARKAKSLIDDDIAPSTFENDSRKSSRTSVSRDQAQQSYQSFDGFRKPESVSSHRSSDSISSSLNHIGGTIKNKFEEGLAIVENKTADIIQETKKINIRRKSAGSSQNQAVDKSSMYNFPQVQADHETQLKASRDVANAMAAKAKLLLRELKTVKADLAFAKERCAQLEEENKMLRESHDKRGPEDDDLIRLQLETLLAEKGRLAHENSLYARENRFLREIVEYHQLTMQDVVYVDEGIEEVTEVFSNSPSQLLSRSSSISNSFNNNIASSISIDEFSTTSAANTLNSSAVVVPEACGVIPTPPTRTKENEDENLKL